MRGILIPTPVPLGFHIGGQAPGEGQHVHHRMLCNDIVKSASWIRNHQRVIDQIPVVEIRRRCDMFALQPPQLFCQRQDIRRNLPVGTIGVNNLPPCVGIGFRGNYPIVWKFRLQSLAPGSSYLILRGEKYKLEHGFSSVLNKSLHRTSPGRGQPDCECCRYRCDHTKYNNPKIRSG